MLPEVRSYLDEVLSHLHLDPSTERQVLRELYTHFQDRVEELREKGLSQGDAVKEALDSFGRTKVVAQRLYEAHSRGSWVEAALAALPHLLIAGLFALHLWRHPVLAPLVFASIVGVTFYAWWQGKPSWLYPWVGYSLLPLLIGGYLSAPIVAQAVSFLWGKGPLPPIGTLLAIFVFLPLATWIVVSAAVKVVRRDWILGSLMIVPLPVFGGWLMTSERAVGLLRGSIETLHQADTPMGVALFTLGLTSAAFIRLRQRVLKVGALVIIGTIALAVVTRPFGGDWGFFGLVATALLLLVILFSPALLEAKVGHGELKGEAWWENGWLKQH